MIYSPKDPRVENSFRFLYRLVLESNPGIEDRLPFEGITFENIRPNLNKTTSRPHNTLVDIYGDERRGVSGMVTFNYNRYNINDYLIDGQVGTVYTPYVVDGVLMKDGSTALFERFKKSWIGRLFDEHILVSDNGSYITGELILYPNNILCHDDSVSGLMVEFNVTYSDHLNVMTRGTEEESATFEFTEERTQSLGGNSSE